MVEFFARYALGSLWSLVWHFGIIAGVAILALAWAWFMPIYKKTALWVALTALVTFFIAGTYTKLGADYVKARWDAAVAADIKRGENARKEAEQAVPPLAQQSVEVGGVRGFLHLNGRVPNDRFDRDRDVGAVQPVAPDPLLVKPGQPKDRTAGARAQPRRGDPAVLVEKTYPCWQVRWAVRTMSKEFIESQAKTATPAQRAAAAKCLEGK